MDRAMPTPVPGATFETIAKVAMNDAVSDLDASSGVFYRRVIAGAEPGCVRSAVEDELHHFEVTIWHDGARITDIAGRSIRYPWTTCLEAPAALRLLIGTELKGVGQSTGLDSKQQCTHSYDLARFAMAQAVRGGVRQYDIGVNDRVNNATRADIQLNANAVLGWDIVDDMVLGPAPFAGHRLAGSPNWAAGLDSDTMEAALLLRRGIFVSQIRGPDRTKRRAVPDGAMRATEDIGMLGSCYTYQPIRADGSLSLHSWRNFSERRDELLAGFAGVRRLADIAEIEVTDARLRAGKS
jgi:hypothetical protein